MVCNKGSSGGGCVVWCIIREVVEGAVQCGV